MLKDTYWIKLSFSKRDFFINGRQSHRNGAEHHHDRPQWRIAALHRWHQHNDDTNSDDESSKVLELVVLRT